MTIPSNGSRAGRTVRPLATLGLVLAVAARAEAGKGGGGHASAPKPPKVHVQAPKAHVQAPKAPQPPRPKAPQPPKASHPTRQAAVAPGQPSATGPHATGATRQASAPNALTAAATGATVGAVAPRIGVRHPHYSGARYWRRPRYYRPMNRQLTPAERRLERLREDIEGIAATSPVTAAQKSTLTSDLMAVAEGPFRPATPPVTQLSGHLADALAGRRQIAPHAGQLALDFKTVLNGARLGKDDINQAIYGGQDLLRGAGVGAEPIRTISQDLTDIALQVREKAQQALNR